MWLNSHKNPNSPLVCVPREHVWLTLHQKSTADTPRYGMLAQFNARENASYLQVVRAILPDRALQKRY
jgi:hypothetical protein